VLYIKSNTMRCRREKNRARGLEKSGEWEEGLRGAGDGFGMEGYVAAFSRHQHMHEESIEGQLSSKSS
jgi:hypothetical protein